MNTKLISSTFIFLAASCSAFASDTGDTPKSRAEIRAELEQAWASGELGQHKEFVEFTNVPFVNTRAAVRSDLADAYLQGKLSQNKEYPEPPQMVSGKTRAEVRAELEHAYAKGELNQNREFIEFTNVASTRTRDEVRQEAIEAAQTSRGAPQSRRN